MRRLIIALAVGLLLYSCAVVKQRDTLVGTYCATTPASIEWIPSGKAIMELSSNGRFNLTWCADEDYNPHLREYRTGTWKARSKAQIWLDFDELDVYDLLTWQAMPHRDMSIGIINSNQLKMNNLIFERTK